MKFWTFVLWYYILLNSTRFIKSQHHGNESAPSQLFWSHFVACKAVESLLLYVDLVKHIRAVGRFEKSGGGGRQVVIQAKVGN